MNFIFARNKLTEEATIEMIIQQIFTMPVYGQALFVICHLNIIDILRYTHIVVTKIRPKSCKTLHDHRFSSYKMSFVYNLLNYKTIVLLNVAKYIVFRRYYTRSIISRCITELLYCFTRFDLPFPFKTITIRNYNNFCKSWIGISVRGTHQFHLNLTIQLLQTENIL